MNKSWMIRKDQEGVSPVIATILMVAITVVLAAVLYVMVTYLIQPPQNQGQPIGFSLTTTGGNWSLVVVNVPSTLDLSTVTMTIKDGNGLIKQPMSSVPLSTLTLDNWNTYKVYYQKTDPSSSLVSVGDSILIGRQTYPAGCTYLFSDGQVIRGTGTF